MTNDVSAIVIEVLKAIGTTPPVTTNQTIQILKEIMQWLNPLLMGIVLYVNSRASKTLEKVHSEVNHDRTVMTEELKQLRSEVLALTGSNRMLEENKRGQEMAAAVKASEPRMAQVSEPSPTPVEIVNPAPVPVAVIKK